MGALLLSLGASLAWGVSDFGGGTAARRHTTITVLLAMRLGGVLLVGTIALATAAPSPGPHWPFALGAVATTSLGGLALLRALAIGPMGIVAPIIAASGVVPAVAGLLKGEAPGSATLAALAVAAAGAVLASRAPGHGGARVDPRGIAYALAAAGLLGVTMLLMHEASASSPVAAVLIQRGGDVVVLATAVAIGGLRLSRPTPRDAGRLLAIGALESCAILSYATASTHGSLTLVAILSSLYPVVTALLARTIHGERLSRPQLVGAALTLVGVVAVVATTA